MQLPTYSLLSNPLSARQSRGWLIAALLMAAVLALNVTSWGTTGGDDTGSGIGGTGRVAEPGSGLGGTGLKPFLGFDPDSAAGPEQQPRDLAILSPGTDRKLALTESLQLDIAPVQTIDRAPLPSPILVANADSFTRDSSAISISEQIQRDLDSNALYFTRAATTAANPVAQDSQRPGATRPSQSTQPEQLASESETSLEVSGGSDRATATENETATNGAEESITWNSLASYLAEQGPVASDAAQQPEQMQRLERPDRIVRPELPPVQRVRPVQRAAVLPPRIKPLSL